MLGGGFEGPKLKAHLQLSGSRIKVIRTKKQNQLLQKRRDIAQLLATGLEPRARIRVEDLVREENTVTAYDILELYCELLVPRVPVIESQKACPADLLEPVASVMWAAPRAADLPELMEVRKMLASKYGKDFVTAVDELRPECGVSEMIVNRLTVREPTDEKKLRLLKAIASEQAVEWDSSAFEKEVEEQKANLLLSFAPPPAVENPQFIAPPYEPPPMVPPHGGPHGGPSHGGAHDGGNPGHRPPRENRHGSWVPAVAEATVAAIAAHALGRHFDDDPPPKAPPSHSAPATAPSPEKHVDASSGNPPEYRYYPPPPPGY